MFTIKQIKQLLSWKQEKETRSVDINLEPEDRDTRAWCYDYVLQTGKSIRPANFFIPELDVAFEKKEKKELERLQKKYKGEN